MNLTASLMIQLVQCSHINWGEMSHTISLLVNGSLSLSDWTTMQMSDPFCSHCLTVIHRSAGEYTLEDQEWRMFDPVVSICEGKRSADTGSKYGDSLKMQKPKNTPKSGKPVLATCKPTTKCWSAESFDEIVPGFGRLLFGK